MATVTPEERLPLTWGVFKSLAVKVKGRGAAAFVRRCAEELDAEQRAADERERRSAKVIPLSKEPR